VTLRLRGSHETARVHHASRQRGRSEDGVHAIPACFSKRLPCRDLCSTAAIRFHPPRDCSWGRHRRSPIAVRGGREASGSIADTMRVATSVLIIRRCWRLLRKRACPLNGEHLLDAETSSKRRMGDGLRRFVCDLGLRSDEGVYPRLQTHGHLDLSHPRQMWPRRNAGARPMVKRCSDRIRIGSNASFPRGTTTTGGE
jgi:hypothetical protein